MLAFLDSPDDVVTLAIMGTIGSGKTLMALKLVEMLNYNSKL